MYGARPPGLCREGALRLPLPVASTAAGPQAGGDDAARAAVSEQLKELNQEAAQVATKLDAAYEALEKAESDEIKQIRQDRVNQLKDKEKELDARRKALEAQLTGALGQGGLTTSPQELANLIKRTIAQQQQQARLDEQLSLADYISQSDSEVGDKMLANAEEERDAQEFLGPLAPEPVTPAMRALVAQIMASMKEEEMQEPMVQLMKEIARAGGVPGLQIVDAHKNGYKLPDGRESCMDAVLSLVPEKQWGAVVSLAEFKYLFKTQKNNHHKPAIGQVMRHWQHVLLFQQTREFLLGLVMDKQELQLWKLYADGTMERSKRYRVFYAPDDQGWQVLVAFVRAPTDRFGYSAALAPAPFNTTAGQLSDIFLVADHGKRQVFNSKLTSSSGSGSTVVLKVASEKAIKAEVVLLQAMHKLGQAVFPQYLAHGTLPSSQSSTLTHYLLTRPYGQHILTADLTSTKLIKYMGDTVTAVELLEQEGWLHRDIKPANLILDPVSGKVILNDYHLATRLPAPYEDVSGAPVTRALRVHRTRQHTIASDLESIFLTYLYLSSNGKALRWRKQPRRFIADIKYRAMFDTDEWEKALGHCKAELRPVLGRLYDKVYRQGNFTLYKQQPVTIEEFSEALKG